MVSAAKKQSNGSRLSAAMAAAAVELLSAQCASDRVRLQYSPQDIVRFSDRQTLQRALASAEALHRFYSQIAAHLRLEDDGNERNG